MSFAAVSLLTIQDLLFTANDGGLHPALSHKSSFCVACVQGGVSAVLWELLPNTKLQVLLKQRCLSDKSAVSSFVKLAICVSEAKEQGEDGRKEIKEEEETKAREEGKRIKENNKSGRISDKNDS